VSRVEYIANKSSTIQHVVNNTIIRSTVSTLPRRGGDLRCTSNVSQIEYIANESSTIQSSKVSHIKPLVNTTSSTVSTVPYPRGS